MTEPTSDPPTLGRTMAAEAWLRGAVPGVPSLLQPVAHALVQARDEVLALVADLPDERLWARPCGVASVGFHLQHLARVVDRLFTYARGEALTAAQLAALAAEGSPVASVSARGLAAEFGDRVELAIAQLRVTAPADLAAPRAVGRRGVPSTVIGLLVHAAEHTTRHVGQLLVTVRVAEAR
jgi:uncharacterized damage-inducible protein DinB